MCSISRIWHAHVMPAQVAGLMLAIFPAPTPALEWALSLQLALLHAAWPQLPSSQTSDAGSMMGEHTRQPARSLPCSLTHDACSTLNSCHDDTRLSTGTAPTAPAGSDGSAEAGKPACLSARIGAFHGTMDRVVPHGKTGRADVLGPPANRAARLMAAAMPGQVGSLVGGAPGGQLLC